MFDTRWHDGSKQILDCLKALIPTFIRVSNSVILLCCSPTVEWSPWQFSGVMEVSIKTLVPKSNKIEHSLQSIYCSNKPRKSDFGKLRWEFELFNVFQGQPKFTQGRMENFKYLKVCSQSDVSNVTDTFRLHLELVLKMIETWLKHLTSQK